MVRRWLSGALAVAWIAACGSRSDLNDYLGADGGLDSGLDASGSGSGGGEDGSGSSSGGEGSSSGGGSGSGSSSGGGSGGSSGSSSGSSGGGGSGSSSGGPTCGPCLSDLDCQIACPPVRGGGVSCCDVPSQTCYATSLPFCPNPFDAGRD